jgi:DNA-binding XRE family transcriptional regulator
MASNKYKKMRRELELSQLQLAKKLGVMQSTISHWETGRCEPSLKMVKKFHKLMGWPA